MKLELNGWRATAAIITAIIIGLTGHPALARDRPGTPNNIALRDCGIVDNRPSFCGVFNNTATEDVVFESQLTENGHAPSPGVQVGCEQGFMPRHGNVPNAPADGVCMLSGLHGEGPAGQFQVRNAMFGATYCISLRARRTSDQVVSAIWSAPACFTTGPAPAFPTAPTIDASYYGAIGPSGGPQQPSQVRVTIGGGGLYATQTVFFNNQEDYNHNGTYHVNPGDDLLTIKACWTNLAGQNCSSEVISIAQQTVVEINGQRIKHTGRPKVGVTGSPADTAQPPVADAPAAPRVLTPGPFFGDWQVAVSDGTQFPINLKQQMGGLTTAFYGSIETQPPGGIRAYTMNKTHVHVTFTMGGAKGEVELEIGPDGRSFIGSGHMADGTPITWTGSKSASPDAAPAG